MADMRTAYELMHQLWYASQHSFIATGMVSKPKSAQGMESRTTSELLTW